MMFLVVLGVCVFIFAIVQIIRGLVMLVKAVFYKTIASEKQIDEGFKKHIIEQSDDYKAFENNLNKSLRNGI